MIFKLFCNHDWSILTTIVQHKISGKFQSQGVTCSESLFETMIYGKTKVVLTCKKCGKIIEREYLGEVNERE